MMVRHATVDGARARINGREMRCALWATLALLFDLTEDPKFKLQFGPGMPPGLNRKALSEEMICSPND